MLVRVAVLAVAIYYVRVASHYVYMILEKELRFGATWWFYVQIQWRAVSHFSHFVRNNGVLESSTRLSARQPDCDNRENRKSKTEMSIWVGLEIDFWSRFV